MWTETTAAPLWRHASRQVKALWPKGTAIAAVTSSCGARPVGKKRGFHVVRVECALNWLSYYMVEFKRSKCRHAPTHVTYVSAKDELDAYRKVKEGHVL